MIYGRNVSFMVTCQQNHENIRKYTCINNFYTGFLMQFSTIFTQHRENIFTEVEIIAAQNLTLFNKKCSNMTPIKDLL